MNRMRLRSKLVLLMLANTAVALVVTVGVLLYRDVVRTEQLLVSNLHSQADILANSIAPALLFNINSDADESLDALDSQHNVEFAAVFNAELDIFSNYGKVEYRHEEVARVTADLAAALRYGTSTDSISQFDEFLILIHPIILDGEPLGTLALIANQVPLTEAVNQTILVSALILLIALLLAAASAFFAQRMISGPLLELADSIGTVSSTGNFEVRAKQHSADEIGDLVLGFNHMLEQLLQRDQEIARHKDELEALVEERTSALIRANEYLESTVRELQEARIEAENIGLAKAQAEARNKAKSEFLANMSHELRTPLNAILGMLSLIEDSDMAKQQQDHLKIAQNAAKTLLSLLNDVLDLSKIEAGKLELEESPVNLRQTIEDEAEIIAQRAFQKGLDMTLEFPHDLPQEVLADSVRLRQIVSNLLSNAVKFSDTGCIKLTLSTLKESSERIQLRLDVRDQGIGVSAEQQRDIFDAFTQADGTTTRKYGGTGLGLALTKELVNAMQGQIDVESTLGLGSCFSCTLSLAKTDECKTHMLAPKHKWNQLLIIAAPSSTVELLAHYLDYWQIKQRHIGDCSSLNESQLHQYDGFIIECQDNTLSVRQQIDHLILKQCHQPIWPLADHTSLHKLSAVEDRIGSTIFKPLRQSQLLDALDNSRISATVKLASAIPTIEFHDAKLLLVEDNPVNQQVALGRLSKMGLKADIANNGIEAFEQVTRSDYDLILMDCQMPLMDGYQCTAEIRAWERQEKHSKRLPIIALTANAMKGDRQKCLDAGMDDYIPKPIQQDMLQGTIKRWLEEDQDGVQA